MNLKTVIFLSALVTAPYVFAQGFKPRLSQDNKNIESRFVYERGNGLREHYIPPSVIESRKLLSEQKSKCKTISDFNKRLSCRNEISSQWYKSNPPRGSKEYVLLTYKDMDRDSAISERDKLIQLMDKVAIVPNYEDMNIELTAEDVEKELFYFEKYILRETPREYFLRP